MISDSELRRQVTLAQQPFRALLAQGDFQCAFAVNPERQTIVRLVARNKSVRLVRCPG
jgi:hypothetical protein